MDEVANGSSSIVGMMSLRSELEGALLALANASNEMAASAAAPAFAPAPAPCAGCRALGRRVADLCGECRELREKAEATEEGLRRESDELRERLGRVQALKEEEGEQLLSALRKENLELKDRLAASSSSCGQESCSLEQLDRLSRENASLRESLQCRDLKVSALESQLREETAGAEEERAALRELREISARLQEEVLSLDKDKIRLSDMVRQSREENEVLGKVMERISKDYEEMKQQQQQQQSPSASSVLFQAKSLPEDAAKIQALRNTARALESENDLLTRERESLESELADLRRELEAKDAERAEFSERFARLEQEKLNVSRRSCQLEQEAEAARTAAAGAAAAARAASDSADAAVAARGAMEEGMDRAARRNQELKEKLRATETLAQSLEETVREAEREKSREEEARGRMEQTMAEQNSIYEAKISAMHREMELRLEEINASKEDETAEVKARYVQMFREKAEELHQAKEKLSGTQAQVRDLQDREEELQNLLSRTRSRLEGEYRERAEEVGAEVRAATERAEKVEAELEETRQQYDSLQESYRGSVQSLGRRLHEITAILREHQEREDEERKRKEENCSEEERDEEVMFPMATTVEAAEAATAAAATAAASVTSEDSAIVVVREEREEEEAKSKKQHNQEGKRKKARRKRRKNKV